MKTKAILAAALIHAATLLNCAAQQGGNDTPYRLKGPEGFVEVSNLSGYFRKMAAAGVSPGGQLLGSYYQPEVLGRMLRGDEMGVVPYCNAQVYRVASSPAEAQIQLTMAAKSVKEGIAHGFDSDIQAQRDLRRVEKQARDEGLPMKVEDLGRIKVLEDRPNCFSFYMVASGKIAEQTFRYSSSCAFIVIDSWVVALTVALPLDETSDQRAAKGLADWVASLSPSPPVPAVGTPVPAAIPPQGVRRYNPVTGKIE